jgi:hypothetical protein
MGRIHEERGGPEHMRWFWTLYGVVGKPPKVHTNDHAPTLDEAKAQFEAVWRQWLSWAKLMEMPPSPTRRSICRYCNQLYRSGNHAGAPGSVASGPVRSNVPPSLACSATICFAPHPRGTP